jgi:hypothetical protein
MTTTRASQRLLERTLPAGARVSTKGEAVVLSVHRGTLQVTVIVPIAVFEWSVEASNRSSGASIEDWCDYEGYDRTPAEQIDLDMSADVEKFVELLLRCELRLDARNRSKVALEWKVGDSWKQAIPMIADAV